MSRTLCRTESLSSRNTCSSSTSCTVLTGFVFTKSKKHIPSSTSYVATAWFSCIATDSQQVLDESRIQISFLAHFGLDSTVGSMPTLVRPTTRRVIRQSMAGRSGWAPGRLQLHALSIIARALGTCGRSSPQSSYWPHQHESLSA